jgi:hypothetical protein
MKEDRTSPIKSAHTAIGVETNLSNVLALVSQGTIAGPIDVAVKKTVIPNSHGIKVVICMFLPVENARNKKKGIMSLGMTTMPLE